METLSPASRRTRRGSTGAGRRTSLQGLRVLAGIVTLVAGSALAAFGSNRSLHPRVAAPDITGTYALNTIAGRPVPTTAQDTTIVDPWGHGRQRLTIVLTGGTVTLAPSGRYEVNAHCMVEVNGERWSAERCTDAGTYAAAGSSLTFTSSMGGVVARGSASDGSLTVSEELLGTEALMLRCLSGGCPAEREAPRP